jgi:hypothetical protein
MQGVYLPAVSAQGCGHFAADSARGSQDQGCPCICRDKCVCHVEVTPGLLFAVCVAVGNTMRAGGMKQN